MAPNAQSIEMLRKRFAQIENNAANIDINGEFSRILDGMEEIKQELNVTPQLAKLGEIIALDFIISRRE